MCRETKCLDLFFELKNLKIWCAEKQSALKLFKFQFMVVIYSQK